MKERRVYPRIKTDWPLFLITDDGQKQVGHVNNISLSGALLVFDNIYELDSEKHAFTLKLSNQQLETPEVVMKSLKTWTRVKKNEINLSLSLEKTQMEKRTHFTQLLSRSNKLHVEALLLIVEKE